MTEKEEKAIETFKHWIEYEKANKEKINKADELIEIQETILNMLEQKDIEIAFYKKIYEDLQKDFNDFKKGKDINYLDGIHHKKLVEKSIGQTIDKPEDCWFDEFEVKIIKNNKLYGVATREDFVNLKQISDEDPENCITVIAESTLSGAIYRYNNYNNKEWQLVGTMLGYA